MMGLMYDLGLPRSMVSAHLSHATWGPVQRRHHADNPMAPSRHKQLG